MFQTEVKEHLEKDLIPFWKGMKDEAHGGFYGFLGFDLNLNREAIKGCILNSRILWFFSNAYMLLKDYELIGYAKHAFLFLKEHFLDKPFGGVYWSLNCKGEPEDTTKHTYNHAFALYALSSYYDASGDKEALEIAWDLYQLIEGKCKDEYGYLESFTRDFKPQANEKLSENGVMAEKTMNTLLHVFEAYTELYRVTKEEDVANQLRFILDVIARKVYNSGLGRQEVFFDKTWNSLIDLYSYGHDIETAWLVDRGLEILDDEGYTRKLSNITREITENIYNRAYINRSLVNESENGIVDTTRVWWVQAEAVVGFLNGYQKTDQKKYLDAAKDIWDYIKESFIDKREGSEWFSELDKNGNPVNKPIVDPWKCPYHNGRMCFEVIRRMKDAS